MSEYHKINSLYKRDQHSNRLLFGQFTRPEFEYLKDNEWLCTEKVDGTNIRVVISPTAEGGRVYLGGRTEKAAIPAKLIQHLQEKFLTNSLLNDTFPDGAILYGEGYGAGIQKGGGNYSKEQQFVMFDVRVGHWWLRRDDVVGIGEKLGVPVVPLIYRGKLSEMENIVANGFSSTWGNFQAEGLVARPAVELRARSGDRIIAKLKYKDFAPKLAMEAAS